MTEANHSAQTLHICITAPHNSLSISLPLGFMGKITVVQATNLLIVTH